MPRHPSSAPPPNVPNEVRNVPIAIPPLWDWQREVFAALGRYRFVIVCSARQIGKSHGATLYAIQQAMQGKQGWWVAPTYHLTNPGYDLLRKITNQPPFSNVIPGTKTRMVTELKTRRRFTFINNGKEGTIEVISADDPESAVGPANDFAVIDEAGRMHPDAWFEGVYSTLTVKRGNALLISNPRGKNWFYDLWLRGDPRNPQRDSDYCSFQFSQLANPLITPADIEKQKSQLPHSKFEREVLGQFNEDGGEVFIGVRAAATIFPGIDPLCFYNPNHLYVAGMDISPGRHDYSAIVVTDVTAMAQVAIYRFSDPLLSRQIDMLSQVNALWRPRYIDVEENSQGMFAIPEFHAIGLPVRPWNNNWKTKGDLIENYAAAIELGRLRLLNDPESIKEHEGMETDVAPGGTIRYHSPKSGFDDIVIAGGLSYHAATVGEDMPQPSFVRGKAVGLYDNRSERRYPGWTSASNVGALKGTRRVGRSGGFDRMNARKQGRG